MSIPNKQIGWSNESNLLWYILKQLNKLTSVISKISGGGYTPPYKVYSALLTQSGTSAPVATVLENTIGNIWFTYIGNGNYSINSNGLFTQNKTSLLAENWKIHTFWQSNLSIDYNNPSSLIMITTVPTIVGGAFTNVATNDRMVNTSIEIRVYN
jgi:hypothetical protein